MVVDEVGARPFGQASGTVGKWSRTSDRRPSVESGARVMPMTGMALLRQ